MAELGCVAGALDQEVAALQQLSDGAAVRPRAAAQALPLRRRLGALWSQLLAHHLAAASTTGELGGIANLEQRSRVHHRFLDRHDEQLARWLGGALPADIHPVNDYAGPARIIVTTARATADAGEQLTVRIRFAASRPPEQAVLRWRWVGESAYREIPLQHVARAVYDGTLPGLDAAHPALEYHVQARVAEASVRWPVSDRGRDHVVMLDER